MSDNATGKPKNSLDVEIPHAHTSIVYHDDAWHWVADEVDYDPNCNICNPPHHTESDDTVTIIGVTNE